MATGIKELVELLLVEGGALLWSIGDGDGVVGAALVVTDLEGVSAVAVLAVSRWSFAAWARQVVVPWTRTFRWVAIVFVTAVGALGVLHISVLVNDGDHVRDGLGVALEHLPP